MRIPCFCRTDESRLTIRKMAWWVAVFALVMGIAACNKQQASATQEASQEEEQVQPECREAGAKGPEEVVRLLYQRYPPDGKKVIENEPQSVLRKYFDDKLAALFFRDHQCTIKEDGVCRLDASTMYDSQDPGVGDLRICAMDTAKHTVAVHFWGGNGRMTVTYQLSHTKRGWRISNMLYPNGRTIVDALSAPFP